MNEVMMIEDNLMGVVIGMAFLTLLVMVIVFSHTEKMLKSFRNSALRKNLQPVFARPGEVVKRELRIEPSGEEYAAIAAAIYLYDKEMYNKERTISTIERTTRTYTPWSVKYYSMNSYFMRKNR